MEAQKPPIRIKNPDKHPLKVSKNPVIQEKVNARIALEEQTLNLGGLSLTGDTNFFPVLDPMAVQINKNARDDVAAELKGERRIRDARNEAYYSSLTGLPNRVLFEKLVSKAMDRMDREVDKAEKEERKPRHGVEMWMIDLDGFGAKNRKHTFGVGNKIIKAFAAAIISKTRKSDIVAHIGGEEFTIAIPFDEDTGPIDFEFFHNRKTTNMSDPGERVREGVMEVDLDTIPELTGKNEHLTASVGRARREPGESYEDFLKRADTATTIAKLTGKNRTVAAIIGKNGENFYHDITHDIWYQNFIENPIEIPVEERIDNGPTQIPGRNILVNISDRRKPVFDEIYTETDDKGEVKKPVLRPVQEVREIRIPESAHFLKAA